VACLLAGAQMSLARAEERAVKLPPPQIDQTRPLMQILKNRSSQRDFSSQELTEQQLSDLLWAACGVNRPESGKRTAPTAMDMQEIDVYIAVAKGLYLYDAQSHALILVKALDLRSVTGKQPFVKDVPLNLIYVADFSKMSRLSGEDRNFYAATDTGFISENVYLYCASAGLATVVRGWFDRSALEKEMGLRPDQKVILTQSVGHPKK
jgi:SagB-type dehydrogenase family enzyme